jgi:hypothetical protein
MIRGTCRACGESYMKCPNCAAGLFCIDCDKCTNCTHNNHTTPRRQILEQGHGKHGDGSAWRAGGDAYLGDLSSNSKREDKRRYGPKLPVGPTRSE